MRGLALGRSVWREAVVMRAEISHGGWEDWFGHGERQGQSSPIQAMAWSQPHSLSSEETGRLSVRAREIHPW